jgi:hypothetical protein
MISIPRSLIWMLSLGLLALPVLAATPTTQEVALGHEPVQEELNELRQSVALLPGGGYAVVWDEGASPHRAIRLQYVRPNGSVVFPDGGLVLASSARNNFGAVAVAHPSSGVFVAFRHMEPGAVANQVLVQWVDGQGRPRWPGEGVAAVKSLVNGLFYYDPRMEVDDKGGVYVCYMFDRNGADDAPIGCQHLDASGERLWSDEGLEVGGHPGWRTVPRIVSDGDGGLFVFWRNQRLHWDDQQIDFMLLEGQRFAPDGTRLWGEKAKVIRTLKLKEVAFYMNGVLNAVPDGRGGAILAFEDWSGTGPLSLDVFALRVTGRGRPVWGKGVALATGPSIQQQDGLIPDFAGGAFVVATEFLGNSRSRPLLFRIDSSGRHAWAQEGIALAEPPGRALDYGAYGSFDDGILRIAWTHQRKPGMPTDIHLARFNAEGRRLTPKAGISLSTAQDMQFLRGFVFDPQRSQGFAVFWDRRSGVGEDMDVYGTLYREP